MFVKTDHSNKHDRKVIAQTTVPKLIIAPKVISLKEPTRKAANRQVIITGAINIAAQTKIIKTNRAILPAHQQNN